MGEPARVSLPVIDARPEPPPRGDAGLRALERPILALDRWIERAIPRHLNPLAQTGAIANTSLIIAIVTGILLLFWYVPSVDQAYGSLEAMRQSVPAQLMRSLHRYSSDACMLFAILHAIRFTVSRRFGGPRWLAWVTGLLAVGVLWFVGWIGYWLVWDDRGQLVALGTAKFLDQLPIFVDPISRSFLTDGTINSLLFFLVFFAHMVIPLLLGVFLWLHITRLHRPRFLTGKWMTAWLLGSMVVVSLVWPATSAGPAEMLDPPRGFTMDWWYLAPLVLTDRLGGGMLWGLVLGSGVLLLSVPWWATRGRAPVAEVAVGRCNDCRQCFADCPYGAITMVPRTDGRRYEKQAQVDPSKCVGCGICAGSCNSAGIGIPQLSVGEVRKNMDARLARWTGGTEGGERPFVAFVCGGSAGAGMDIDPDTGRCEELPGYLVWAVPCAGWVHALTVGRALKHGAAGVLIVACPSSSCEYREGPKWTDQRMASEREPELALARVDPERVRVLHLGRGRRQELRQRAAAFREGTEPPAGERPRRRSPWVAALAGAGLVGALGTVTTVASDAPYAPPPPGGAELVVSFSHPGSTGEQCRELTEQEKAEMPVHMRRDRICERGRSPVRLRVRVDGETRHERAHEPHGLFGDENSIAVVHVPVDPGEHHVGIAIGDTSDPDEWTYRDAKTVDFGDSRRVVLFDRSKGFAWHR